MSTINKWSYWHVCAHISDDRSTPMSIAVSDILIKAVLKCLSRNLIVLLFSIEAEGDEGEKKGIEIFMVVAIVVYRQSIEEENRSRTKSIEKAKKAHFSIFFTLQNFQ